MVKIATSELKKFFDYARPIKESRLLPIYQYVKLVCQGDSAILCKSNGHSFVVCQVKAEFKKNITLILEEKKLSGIAINDKKKEITISEEGNAILITDGSVKLRHQKQEDVYPIIQPKTDNESTTFSTEILAALYVARNHGKPIDDPSVRPWMSYVHIAQVNKKSYIVGTNGMISFFKSFKEKLPSLCLDYETIAAIKQFSEVTYSRIGNYDYFESGIVSYGFIKSESTVPDFTPLLEKFKSNDYLIVNKQSIIDFCQLVIRINSSFTQPEVMLTSDGKKGIKLSFTGMADDESAEEPIKCKEKTFNPEDFLFIPDKMIIALKDIDSEMVKLSHIEYHFIFTTEDDKNYIGAIMQIAKLNNPVVKS